MFQNWNSLFSRYISAKNPFFEPIERNQRLIAQAKQVGKIRGPPKIESEGTTNMYVALHCSTIRIWKFEEYREKKYLGGQQ